jgi:UDP-galactose-lipid carrier transferase
MNRDHTNYTAAAPVRGRISRAGARAALCGLALSASDAVTISTAGHIFNGPGAWPDSQLFERFDHASVAAFMASALAILRLASLRHYSNRLPMLRELRELFGALIFACACHFGLLILRGYATEIVPALLMWGYAAALVPTGRLIVKLILMRAGLWQRDLYIIGSDRLALDAATAVKAEVLMGLALRAFIPGGENRLPLGTPVAAISPLNAPSLAGSVVMVALQGEHDRLRQAWVRALGAVPVDVVLVADVPGVPLHGMRTTYVKSHELLLMQVRDNLSRWHVRFFKRCLDLVGAISISLILAPFLLYIAWQVRKDGGRAIYGHPRIGRNGRPFNCYKFRSMVVDANAKLAELLERDPEAKRDWDRDFKLKNDPRVTRVGSFLRRTSLDELPQLWNVIRGDMSLVGARPEVPQFVDMNSPAWSLILKFRPGITDPASIAYRNEESLLAANADPIRFYEETVLPAKLALNIAYLEKRSFWMDLRIIGQTALCAVLPGHTREISI